jgi:transcriptional regulator with XRE-family HTH domain
MSQAELAAAIGVTKSTICRYERGRAVPRLPHLEQLASVLHCRVADLFAPIEAKVPRRLRARLEAALSKHDVAGHASTPAAPSVGSFERVFLTHRNGVHRPWPCQ